MTENTLPEILTLTATHTVRAGAGCLCGATFGVAIALTLLGMQGQFRCRGVVPLRKATGQAWAEGQAIFWDEVAMQATTLLGGNFAIGSARSTAVDTTEVGFVVLSGLTEKEARA